MGHILCRCYTSGDCDPLYQRWANYGPWDRSAQSLSSWPGRLAPNPSPAASAHCTAAAMLWAVGLQAPGVVQLQSLA